MSAKFDVKMASDAPSSVRSKSITSSILMHELSTGIDVSHVDFPPVIPWALTDVHPVPMDTARIDDCVEETVRARSTWRLPFRNSPRAIPRLCSLALVSAERVQFVQEARTPSSREHKRELSYLNRS